MVRRESLALLKQNKSSPECFEELRNKTAITLDGESDCFEGRARTRVSGIEAASKVLLEVPND
jgi:hypothetical protein